MHLPCTNPTTIAAGDKRSPCRNATSPGRIRSCTGSNTRASARRKVADLEKDLANTSEDSEETRRLLLVKNHEIQLQLNKINDLNMEKNSLDSVLETFKIKVESLNNDLKNCSKNLRDRNREIDLLKKNLSARQFHLSVLRTQKEKLAETVRRKTNEIDYTLWHKIDTFSKAMQVFDVDTSVVLNPLLIDLTKANVIVKDLERKIEILRQNISDQTIAARKELEQTKTNLEKEKQEIFTRKDTDMKRETKVLQVEIKHLTDELNLQAEFRIKQLENHNIIGNSKIFFSFVSYREDESKNYGKERPFCVDLRKDAEFWKAQCGSLKKKVKYLESEINQNLPKKRRNHTETESKFHQARRADSILSQYGISNKKEFFKTRIKLKEVLDLHQAFTDSTQQQIKRIENFEKDIQKLKQQVTDLNVRNNNVKCVMEQLEKKNNDLNSEAIAKENQFRATLKALKEKEHELEVSKNKALNLAAEKQTCNIKMAEKLNELTKMNDKIDRLMNELAKAQNAIRQKKMR
ncbi:uncharacterized protein CEXT_215841 [Caerostris extrusa]|uniref:Uncharacterized protein n=1 Tax=Caerostris extrusa TaxID=172846 RepID=A0AAV4QJF7_CAEEX|nr:uncharacterized protein CEXT_215841 [Caerostris extrusa]